MAFPTIQVTPGTGTTVNTLPNAGAATSANSLPVVLATDQAAVPVTLASSPLPAGASTAANQATEITSLAAIATSVAANATAANQATTNATLGSILTAVNAPTPAGTNLVGKVGIDQTTPGTTNAVQVVAGASGGCTPSHRVSTADTNSVVLKASPGTVYGFQFVNANAAARYVKFFNKASAATLGTDAPVKTICVPGGTAAQPTVVTLGQPVGLAFSLGIAIAITALMADADATAISAGDLLAEVDTK